MMFGVGKHSILVTETHQAYFFFKVLDNAERGGNVTLHEYFTEGYDLQGRDIGVPKDLSTKIRKFKVSHLPSMFYHHR